MTPEVFYHSINRLWGARLTVKHHRIFIGYAHSRESAVKLYYAAYALINEESANPADPAWRLYFRNLVKSKVI
jgi:hypothetical protein